MTSRAWATTISAMALAWASPAWAQSYGPFNVEFPAGGDGVTRALAADGTLPVASTSWTLAG